MLQMRSCWSCLFVVSALIIPALSAQDAKKEDEKKEEKKKPASTAVVYGEIMKDATFKQFDGENKTDLTVEVWKADKDKMAEFQRWYAQQRLNLLKANVQARQQFQTQLAQKQKEMMTSAEMKLKAGENIVIRSIKPLVLDAQGNPKKLTEKEKAALKGSGKLPGYQAGAEALQAGVTVDIYFAKVKGAGPTPKGKKKTDDVDLGEGAGAPKPAVVMILIKTVPAAEPPPAK